MAATYDPATPLGLVRLLITDTNIEDPYFSDDEITAFLSAEGDNPKMAASLALVVLASNEVLVNKIIKMQELEIDSEAVSKELRQLSDRLRDSAIADMGFQIAETPVTGPGYDEKTVNDLLREM